MVPELTDNRSIVEKLRLGDEAVLGLLFKAYFKPFYYYALKFNIEEQDAKDIVHTTFLKLWNIRSQLLPDTSVRTFLYKVLTNKCLDYLRHRKVKEDYYLKQDWDDANNYISERNPDHPLQRLSFSELSSAINAAVSNLPPQMRQIFEMSRVQGLKYSEIAAELDISIKTVETQMSRALAKLRLELKDYMPEVAIALVALNTFFLLKNVPSATQFNHPCRNPSQNERQKT